jgi:hypothetical protein
MTDSDIIKLILQGEKEKFRLLVEQYQQMVFRTCMGFVHNKDDADDLTQEVFIQTYQSLSRFKGDSGFAAVTTLASAQTQGSGQGQRDGKGNGAAFIDNNKNGVCDNYENGTPRQGLGKRKATGKGQGYHRGNGQSRGNGQCRGGSCNFTDENKNGICDYRETTAGKK